MKNPMLRNFFRQIRKSLSRFLSILCIVALGGGFFVGVKAASPSMEYSAEQYFKNNNLMDYRLVSDYGFKEDDIKALEEMKGIKDVMPSYCMDLLLSSSNTTSVVRMQSLPADDKNSINRVEVIEGRLPLDTSECVVEYNDTMREKYKIGDYIEFSSPTEDIKLKDIVKNSKYKIVGFIESPQYISYKDGVSQYGNGNILSYVMVLPEEFTIERYTEVYLTTDFSSKYSSPFGDNYFAKINSYEDDIKQIADIRLEKNYDEMKALAIEKLNEAKNKLATEKKNAEEQIAASEEKIRLAKDEIAEKEKEISDGENKLYNSAEQLAAARNKIAEGEEALAAAKEEYNNKCAEGVKKISDAENQYNIALAEYNKKNEEFQAVKSEKEPEIAAKKEELAQAQESLDAAKKIYDELAKHPEVGVDEAVDGAVEEIENNYELTEEQKAYLEEIAKKAKEEGEGQTIGDVLPKIKEEIDSLQKQIDEGNAALAEAEKQLQEAQNQLDQAQNKLAESKAEIDNGKAVFEQQKIAGQNEIDNAEAQLNVAKQQLADGEAEYNEGQAQLESGKEQLAAAKEEVQNAQQQVDDAKAQLVEKLKLPESQLATMEKEIDEIDIGKWYVFNRKDNSGFTSFIEDTNRIDGIASIFPLFFYLVAALVCLTTMTRMVEEERTEIGTLKALGYKNSTIALKYFFYAFLAAVIGSILGIVIGLNTLPKIIYSAYDSMYKLPIFKVKYSVVVIIISIVGALLSTCTVAFIVAYEELKINPAVLMRPKAPKQGKRILLERVSFIWKRLSFSSKVTIRNLLRYKARLAMTVLGVAGCTALILSAYGLRDSISVVVSNQYGNIFKYDSVISLKKEGVLSEKEALLEVLEKDKSVTSDIGLYRITMNSSSKNSDEDVEINFIVPQKEKDLTKFIKFIDKETDKNISLDDDSVIITEKLAQLLDIDKGDEIFLADDSQNFSLKVTNIVENYAYNYVYISPVMYENIKNSEVKLNTILLSLTKEGKENEEKFSEEWLTNSDVLVITGNSSIIDAFNEAMVSMDSVVVVMIVCAAALAFVVLYNLTNINVAERIREIATIKVLGFTDRESSNYVFRENVILSILGILVGLVAGIFLCRYLILSIEMNIVVFGKKISAISFIYAALYTFIFTLLVNLVMHRKLNKISMVESLKSVE